MARLQLGVNDLATVRPDLAKQLVDPSLAATVTQGSHKKLLWFCETNHPRYEWPSSVDNRSRGRGCGACSGKAVIPGWNDLGTVCPDLAAQLVDPSLATTVTEFSDKRLLWFCEKGHPSFEWEADVRSRSRGRGCRVCAGQEILVGWNDLGTVNPELAKKLVDPSQAEKVTAGSNKKLLWFCETGHPRNEWETSVANRSKGSGCSLCAETGYDSSKPGDFYRFEFVDQGVPFLCYGISNVIEKRRKTYESHLEVKNFQSLHFDKGSIPQELERKFHQIRKESSAPTSTCGVEGTKTESFPISDIELATFFEAHWAYASSAIDH